MRVPADSHSHHRLSSIFGGRASYPLKFADTASLAAMGIAIITLAACAPLEPQRPLEVRAVTAIADKPIAAPCFTEDERPVLAPPTPIDIEHATADQIAFALKADAINEQLYTKAVDAIFLKCKATGETK